MLVIVRIFCFMSLHIVRVRVRVGTLENCYGLCTLLPVITMLWLSLLMENKVNRFVKSRRIINESKLAPAL